MSNVKYDIANVPRELLEKYLKASLPLLHGMVEISEVEKEILKSAEVLRTRSEVDAEIVKSVRDYVAQCGQCIGLSFNDRLAPTNEYIGYILSRLAVEETSD